MSDIILMEPRKRMVRTDFFMDEDMKISLEEKARLEGTNVSVLIRDALSEYLNAYPEPRKRELTKIMKDMFILIDLMVPMLAEEPSNSVDLRMEDHLLILFKTYRHSKDVIRLFSAVMKKVQVRCIWESVIDEIMVSPVSNRTRQEKVGFKINFLDGISASKLRDKKKILLQMWNDRKI